MSLKSDTQKPLTVHEIMCEYKEYEYKVKFYSVEGEYVTTERFTVTAHDKDQALSLVDDIVQEECDEQPDYAEYGEAEISLEDVH